LRRTASRRNVSRSRWRSPSYTSYWIDGSGKPSGEHQQPYPRLHRGFDVRAGQRDRLTEAAGAGPTGPFVDDGSQQCWLDDALKEQGVQGDDRRNGVGTAAEIERGTGGTRDRGTGATHHVAGFEPDPVHDEIPVPGRAALRRDADMNGLPT
jgi:hypothetical protein